MQPAKKKPRVKQFQQPFPIQPSVCSYLEFYPPLFSSQHISTPWCASVVRYRMRCQCHQHRTHSSDSFFRPAIRKSDSSIFVRIHFTLLLSRNKSNVCGAGLCLGELRAVVFDCFFFFHYLLKDLSCCVVHCSQYGTHKQTQMFTTKIERCENHRSTQCLASEHTH